MKKMPKVIGVVGYHNSGKTTLIHALARELTNRGHDVAVIKHMSHHLDLPGKDTAILGEVVDQVAFVSPRGSGIFWSRTLSLEGLVSHLQADIVLVEGFKAERTYPKIICLRGRPDDAQLLDDLVICAVAPPEMATEMAVQVLSRDQVAQIADLVEQEAVTLPDTDSFARKGPAKPT